jgi:transcriptional regulator with XRE-family HTH domain
MTTSFARALTEALEAKQSNITELADKIDSSYEYVRQLTKGNALPGRHLLKAICGVLGLNYASTSNLVVGDKLSRKYGDDAYTKIGKNPRFLEIERLLPQLTEEQFQFILGAIEGIAKRNRVHEPAKIPAVTRAEAGNAKHKYRTLAAQATKSRPVHPGILKSEETKEAKR